MFSVHESVYNLSLRSDTKQPLSRTKEALQIDVKFLENIVDSDNSY